MLAYFLPRALMRSRGRVFGLSVSLSVCLFVRLSTTFWPVCTFKAFSRALYTLTQQIDQVEKVAYRWSAIEMNGLEARKTLVLTRG